MVTQEGGVDYQCVVTGSLFHHLEYNCCPARVKITDELNKRKRSGNQQPLSDV